MSDEPMISIPLAVAKAWRLRAEVAITERGLLAQALGRAIDAALPAEWERLDENIEKLVGSDGRIAYFCPYGPTDGTIPRFALFASRAQAEKWLRGGGA